MHGHAQKGRAKINSGDISGVESMSTNSLAKPGSVASTSSCCFHELTLALLAFQEDFRGHFCYPRDLDPIRRNDSDNS
jgi:hypothetical protein